MIEGVSQTKKNTEHNVDKMTHSDKASGEHIRSFDTAQS